ncbi:MAG: DUF1415 family protein [Myxococcota bacterium]|nr:DUF1415 family protein [Myxococcota bacterium]
MSPRFGADALQDARVQELQRWVLEWVVGLNLCPFAKAPLDSGRVGWGIEEGDDSAVIDALLLAIDEIEAGRCDTLLLALPWFLDFYELMDCVAACEALLDQAGLSERYQLAHFHPRYIFEDVEFDDASNLTNRSPVPALHLLRTQDVAWAVDKHPDIASVPERNVALLRELAAKGQLPG